ncbi:MAG: ABC transporter transmembrane domain-containing protein [Arenicellales bacterium]|nr:ABC transporter transmembrane domain-containing protein [Arenicellales bacterium]
MDPSIYRYILKHTLKDQIYLMLLTAASMPFVYISLEIPKKIINEAIGGENIPDEIFGFDIDQITYLLILCGVFLLLVFINGGLKYLINVYRGVLGERMLRRFRYELYSRILRFPLPHFKRTSQGEIIPMITAETEPLGGFIGDAFALPAFQGGLLLTYLSFIFVQDPWLGLAAIALYPPQIYLIPKLQKKVNQLAKQRVQTVRKLADGVGESVSGVTEIHANDTSLFERAKISDRLATIYDIRFDIYKRKFFIKFLNNFLGMLTPFFFYSIGGFFVIQGELSLGALVAVLAAYKDIGPPWKELLKFYQITEDVRVKYGQIIEQFQPENMLDVELQQLPEGDIQPLQGTLVSSNVRYTEDQVVNIVDGANFRLALDNHVCIVGSTGSGKDEIARLIARLIFPSAGRFTIDEENLSKYSEAILGRRISYVGPNAHVFTGTVFNNVVYGLKHRPMSEVEYDEQAARKRARAIKEARATGTSSDDVNADWIDYGAAGVEDHKQLVERILETLKITDLDEDIYKLGLNGTITAESHMNLVERVLEARNALRERLSDPKMAALVESFDRDHYNTNMSVAENLLFGTSIHPSFDTENLSNNDQVLKVLEECGLIPDFLKMGRKIADIMLELFADVPSDSELFEQFSFISAEDLPVFHGLLNRTDENKLDDLPEEDRTLLLSLPFKLIPARHRLGLIDEAMQERLLEARRVLYSQLGEENEYVSFFDREKFNPAITIQDNILFGRLVYGQARAQTRVGELIKETVDALDLRKQILMAGLEYEVGIAGARLSLAQRQKLVITRGLMKRPDVLILNDATSPLDPAAENQIIDNLIQHMTGRGLIAVLSRPELAPRFEHTIVLENGKVLEQGVTKEITDNSSAFQSLMTQN